MPGRRTNGIPRHLAPVPAAWPPGIPPRSPGPKMDPADAPSGVCTPSTGTPESHSDSRCTPSYSQPQLSWVALPTTGRLLLHAREQNSYRSRVLANDCPHVGQAASPATWPLLGRVRLVSRSRQAAGVPLGSLGGSTTLLRHLHQCLAHMPRASTFGTSQPGSRHGLMRHRAPHPCASLLREAEQADLLCTSYRVYAMTFPSGCSTYLRHHRRSASLAHASAASAIAGSARMPHCMAHASRTWKRLRQSSHT